jgi:DNA-binding transcriptional LysR family regulator
MDMAWLTVFCEAARHGTFTGAGESLGYTQSAISRQIALLENELGAVLFERLPRGVRLSEHGEAFLPHAQALLDRMSGARKDLTAITDLSAGRLRLGAFASVDAVLVPRALATFRAAHPDVSISLIEGLSLQLLGRLLAGELDMALVAAYPDAPFDAELYELRMLTEDPVLVALHPDHPLAEATDIRLKDLSAEKWIAGHGRAEDTLLSACLSSGFRPDIEYVVQEWTAKLGLVAAGLGPTLVPSLAAQAAPPGVALRSIHPADRPVRHVHIATRRTQQPSPALRAFTAHLEEATTTLAQY